jgi:hypothetical protein
MAENSMEQQLNETISPLLSEEAIIDWKVKAIPVPPTAILKVRLLFTAIVIIAFGSLYIFSEPTSADGWFAVYILCLILFFLKVVIGQKTIYQYQLTTDGAEVSYYLDFPKAAGIFFKWLSYLFLLVVVAMLAYDFSLALILSGPAGMAFFGARFFLSWKNTPKTDDTLWKNHDLIILDRKRNMAIASYTDHPLFGFEMYLPKDKSEDVIGIIKELLPQAEVIESDWV